MDQNKSSSSGAFRVPSQSEIAEIIADSDNPSLRNLRITLCYSELSRAIATRLGPENVNWCTFATWASKTAGRFIRLTNLDEHVRAALRQHFGTVGWTKTIHDRLTALHLPAGLELGEETVLEAASNIATGVSAEVAAGNLTVFAELAPLFASLTDAMDRAKAGDFDAEKAVVETLRPGAVGGGGQELLRQAVADYFAARREGDPRRKAELILRSNAQVGAHEQIRLQDYIEGAMKAPLADGVRIALQRKLRALPGAPRPGLEAALDMMLRPYRTALEQVWLQVSTRYLMTLELPNGTLHLGRDLPNIPGRPLFPPDLTELRDPELLRILRIYHADGVNARSSGASEWSNLSDRMRYILELFRSRQQDACLFEAPFTIAAIETIDDGTVPLIGV